MCACLGLLLRMFMNLYNFEVIDEDAFMQWKEELNDIHPGKGQALFQVRYLVVHVQFIIRVVGVV